MNKKRGVVSTGLLAVMCMSASGNAVAQYSDVFGRFDSSTAGSVWVMQSRSHTADGAVWNSSGVVGRFGAGHSNVDPQVSRDFQRRTKSHTVDGCKVVAGTRPDGWPAALFADGGIELRNQSAGTLRIDSSNTSDLVVERPGTDGFPYILDVNRRLFSGDDALKVSASGGEVPAFSHTIRAPSLIEVEQPKCDMGACGALPRTETFAVTWSRGVSGTVLVSIDQTVGSSFTSAECTFPASAGKALISPNVLQHFKAGPTSLTVENTTSTKISVGDFLTEIKAVAIAASGQATLY
jgi:hypothetical protein